MSRRNIKKQRMQTTDGIVKPISSKRKKIGLGKKQWLSLGVAVIVILILLIIFVFHSKTKNQNNLQVVKDEVSKHILLPQNEQPALATVIDKSKLNKQLFAKAQNGDKVLIYQNNKELIIYRSGIDRIVDVQPIKIDAPPSQLTQ